MEAVKESSGGGGVWSVATTDCPVTGRPGLGVDTNDNTRQTVSPGTGMGLTTSTAAITFM